MIYAELKPSYSTNEWQPILDSEHGEYLLLKFVADKNGESKTYQIFQFRLKNGKVFIEENNTDSDIVSELLSLGIVEKDLLVNQLA